MRRLLAAVEQVPAVWVVVPRHSKGVNALTARSAELLCFSGAVGALPLWRGGLYKGIENAYAA